jgi:hypothetical protein
MVRKSTKSKEKETLENLVEIRCPFSKRNKQGKVYPCETLTVKVYPGSSGESWCRWCKIPFSFEVNGEIKTFVKVQNANKN